MQPADNPAADFVAHRDREQRRYYARKPKKIADVVAQVVTTRGYGRVQSIENLAEAWQESAGEVLARFSRPGRFKRGVLEVTASTSTVVQELSFQKQNILAILRARFPDATLRDLRFRVGSIV
jgi:predicted nucleic acid-binding Zn ribbon protein